MQQNLKDMFLDFKNTDISDDIKYIDCVLRGISSAIICCYESLNTIFSQAQKDKRWYIEEEDKRDLISNIFCKLVYGYNGDEPGFKRFNPDFAVRLYYYIYGLIVHETNNFLGKKRDTLNIGELSETDLVPAVVSYTNSFSSLDFSIIHDDLFSRRQYQTFVLSVFCDFSAKDIAEILNISVKSVSKYRKSAIKKLQNRYF